MKVSRDVYKAYETLKKTCDEAEDCKVCPFRNPDNPKTCMCKADELDVPSEWSLDDFEVEQTPERHLDLGVLKAPLKMLGLFDKAAEIGYDFDLFDVKSIWSKFNNSEIEELARNRSELTEEDIERLCDILDKLDTLRKYMIADAVCNNPAFIDEFDVQEEVE